MGAPHSADGRVQRPALRRDRAGARSGPQGALSMEAIEHPPIFHLPGIPDHVTYTWLSMIILTSVAFAASRNVRLVPRGLQNFLEVVLEQVLEIGRASCRKECRSRWSPYH